MDEPSRVPLFSARGLDHSTPEGIDMTTIQRLLLATAALNAFAIVGSACGGGSSSSGTGAGSSGMVNFSCTLSGVTCVEGTALPSEIAAEQKVCAQTPGGPGIFTMSPCTGVVGCCQQPGNGAFCSFQMPGATMATYESSCAKLNGTWVPADGGTTGTGGSTGTGGAGGATGASAFVGTWTRSGTQTITCGTGNPTTTMISGNLVIALGSTSGTIIGTTPDGCGTNYTVSGSVATAMAGEACNTTTDAGVAETITVGMRTFTLSANGLSLMTTGTFTIDKTATMTMCSGMGSGTYTKQ